MVLVAKPKRRTTSVHDKRRAGRHHKRNDHYLKAYWPYLPMALIVGLGIFANTLLGPHTGVLGYATDMSVGGLLQDTNSQRTGNGLGNLTLNSQLAAAAQAKANDMASRDYWSHNTPDGTPPWTFITNAGYYYQTAGENLAYGFDTSDYVVTAWMNSPEHRANILNTTYQDVGFGIANAASYQGSGPETIVVAEYASPRAAAAAQPSAPAASTPATTTPTPSQPASTTPTQSTPTASSPTPTAPTASASASPSTTVQNTAAGTSNPKPATTSKSISRIQLLAGKQAPWSVFAVSTVASVSLAIFILRHGLLWRRVLVKSERFVLKHKILDVGLVAVAVLGAVLTRTVGLIR